MGGYGVGSNSDSDGSGCDYSRVERKEKGLLCVDKREEGNHKAAPRRRFGEECVCGVVLSSFSIEGP